MGWFRRLGLQRRIMLYVALGLALMFGAIAYGGLQAIRQATDQVYRERLATALATAGMVEQDLRHLAHLAQTQGRRLVQATTGQEREAVGRELVAQIALPSHSRFIVGNGLWLVGPGGEVVFASPPSLASEGRALPLQAPPPSGELWLLPPAKASPGSSFGMLLVPAEEASAGKAWVVVLHLLSVNSQAPFAPSAVHGLEGHQEVSTYHLEVVGPDGQALLAQGEEVQPGRPSRHWEIVRQRAPQNRGAFVLLHRPNRGEEFPPHVLAVVSLTVRPQPYWLILEQPEDVALALPLHLRKRLALFIGIAFSATLLVAWVTTRHVVRPTELLTQAAQRMAGGHLGDPIRVVAQDEVGTLAESLEAMRQQLQSALAKVAQANQELEARVKERTARLQEVLGKVISAQEEERRRLARELHDETAQTLSALCIMLDQARDALPPEATDALEAVQEAKRVAEGLLNETRRLILDLRPTALDDFGLLPAIRWYAESHLEERGIQVSLQARGLPSRLPRHLEVALFRIVQEAINNIAKHAQARHAHIALQVANGTVQVTVADDGKGFEVARVLSPASRSTSVGLLGMQERVTLLGGRLEVDSAPGQGTRLRATIPLEEG
ncbi:Signal transduction histidine-protein kinase/phosphatase DegS [bacterium HR23]|nr:Signal transduction histidine-protein kinase/phosphatase DegS [bacterium HR23]